MNTVQTKFGTKLTIIVGAITFGFIALIAANILIASRVESELGKIHEYYIPLIELGPHLETQFNRVMRGMQDAVAAHDIQGLEATHTLNIELTNELTKEAEVIYPGDSTRISLLQTALKNNYDIAHSVSLRLMRNETGLSIVNALSDMRRTYRQTNEMLQKALIFDKNKLAEAFTAVAKAQKTAQRLQLSISSICLVSVLILTSWIGRNLLQSITLLKAGLMRFSEGNFDVPIPITSRDELGVVANNANLMAKQIQTLLIETKAANKELESFSYSVAHDLRAPLRASLGFSNALLEDFGSILPAEAKEMLNQVALASNKMGELIDGLLSLSRIARNAMVFEAVNLSNIAHGILVNLRQAEPERNITVEIEEEVIAHGDPKLLEIVMTNLIGNAWKFTRKETQAKIEFGKKREDGQTVFFVRDNGAGFDMRYAEKLFGTFQRLHSEAEFEGTGIGLATVQRIIHRHHGKIWAEAEPGKGATFFFKLG